MHLSKCIGPAAVECLFEGLHGNARPTYDDFTYCLDACDATRVLELPIDAALCHADAPLELAARMREALSIAFKPVSCVDGGGGSSAGPITITAGQESVNLSGASLDYFWSQPSGPPLFVRVGLLTQDMIDREIVLPEASAPSSPGKDTLHSHLLRLRSMMTSGEDGFGFESGAGEDGGVATCWLVVHALQRVKTHPGPTIERIPIPHLEPPAPLGSSAARREVWVESRDLKRALATSVPTRLRACNG